MLYPRRRLSAVADGDHHRRGREPGLAPGLQGLAPVVAQQVVGVEHQVGQRLVTEVAEDAEGNKKSFMFEVYRVAP